MANEPPDPSDPQSEDEVAEWIENIATAEDMPPQEVLERLLSSYWVLEEIQEMLDGTEYHPSPDSESARGMEPPQIGSSTTDTEEELAEIRTRLDSLEEQSHADHTQTEAYEEVQGQLTMLTQRINAIKEQLTDRQRSLESRLDQEVEYLIPTLDYLIDTTDIIREDLDAISEQQATQAAQPTTSERLVDLKQQASRLGIHTATCEHCGTAVDLQLLPTPECPDCERPITDIEPASGWFGLGIGSGPDTLRVREGSSPSS